MLSSNLQTSNAFLIFNYFFNYYKYLLIFIILWTCYKFDIQKVSIFNSHFICKCKKCHFANFLLEFYLIQWLLFSDDVFTGTRAGQSIPNPIQSIPNRQSQVSLCIFSCSGSRNIQIYVKIGKKNTIATSISWLL